MKNGLLKNVAISAVSAELAAFIFLIISTFFTYKTEDPDMMSGLLGISALLFGAMVCGMISGVIKCGCMTCAGIISPAVYILLQFITVFFTPHTQSSALEMGIKTASIMIISFIMHKLMSRKGRKRRSKRPSKR